MRQKYDLKPQEAEHYEMLIQLVKGDYNKPVRDRTRSEKTVMVLFWRNKKNLHVRKLKQRDVLFFGKRRVLTKAEFRRKVKEQVLLSKGGGARTIAYSLKKNFSGCSEREVLKVFKTNKDHGLTRAQFKNRAPIKPITANSVFERIQVDLINMRTDAVAVRDLKYNYILTAVDVFSRFVFLRPLQNKSAKCVAEALQDIFEVHGYPTIIQMDNGTEFKGKVKRLLMHSNIKIIKGRPYHPQSQGKVERANRIVRQKIRYDIMKKRKRGYNWVESLQSVASAINNQPKEVLAYQTPFVVYFGRSNSGADRVRNQAKLASERCAAREMTKFSRLNGCSIYIPNDKVLIKYPPTKKRVPTKYCVLGGIILRRNKSYSRYYVKFTSPEGKQMKRWVDVEFITSQTTEKEKKRREWSTRVFKKKQRKALHRQKYYIPLNKEIASNFDENRSNNDLGGSYNERTDNQSNEDLSAAEKSDFFFEDNRNIVIAFNPTKYGNCQFDAIANQISKIGLHRTGNQLRTVAVTHITENREEYLDFVQGNINTYLRRMSRNCTYGDHLTLQALSIEFFCQFLIISAEGFDYNNLISATGTYADNLPLLTLGYYPENRGEHYVSVEVEPGLLHALINRVKIQGCHHANNSRTNNIKDCTDEETRTYNSDATTEDYTWENNLDTNNNGKCKGTQKIMEEADDSGAQPPDEGESWKHGNGDQVKTSTDEEEEAVNDSHSQVEGEDDIEVELGFSENGESEGSNQYMQALPSLVLEKIIRDCVLLFPEMLFTLQHVSVFFREVIARIGYPSLYLDSTMMPEVPDVISVRRLIRTFGRNSGLMISVRDTLRGFGGSWVNAWLELRPKQNGWFDVIEVYWRME